VLECERHGRQGLRVLIRHARQHLSRGVAGFEGRKDSIDVDVLEGDHQVKTP
jgi:hypothetical protein